MEKLTVLGRSSGGSHRMSTCLWRPAEGAAAENGEDRGGRGTVVCVHGLTRNARDFDPLAAALSGAGFLTACPDVVGRGESDWLADPAGYGGPQYAADMTALIAHLEAPAVDWIGTSMGGLIGMILAAQPDTPLRRLVLNDVGPFIPRACVAQIADYVGNDPRFADLDEAETYLRAVHAEFGLHDEGWRHMAEHSVRPDDVGGFRLRYDPEIVASLGEAPFDDVDLWDLWDAIDLPVLVLRGAQSQLLRPETAAEMARRGPRARVVEIPDCGHAPGLMDPAQIAIVRDWLLAEAGF